MSDPVASLLIPAYNAEATLAETLESASAQTERAIEILVMDDGSADRTSEIAAAHAARDPRIRPMRQENAGKSVAMNAMIAAARGRHLAVLDSDDLAEPERIAAAVARLEAEPGLAAVMSGVSLILDGAAAPCAPRAEAKDPARCAAEIADLRMPAHDPTLVARAEVARATPYCPELRIAQGVDVVLRIGERLPIAVIGRALYRYRVRQGSQTRSGAERRARYLRLMVDRAHARRGLPPMGEAAFRARFRGAIEGEDNDLAAHFVDSAFLQATGGDRLGAVRTAWTALSRLGPGSGAAKAAIYALSPAPLARRLRRRGRAPG